jgi:hypothetical protein
MTTPWSDLALQTRATRAAALALLCLAGCRLITGDDTAWRRRVGVIGTGGDQAAPEVLQAPAEATAGVPFAVTVTTFGGGCIRSDGVEGRYAGLVVELTPYDIYHEGPGVVCTLELRFMPRKVSVRFDASGVATIRLRGRRGFGTSGPDAELVTIERQVTVR